jgi:deazaflavin-dependent oxidoreductase (nitroreductase family)
MGGLWSRLTLAIGWSMPNAGLMGNPESSTPKQEAHRPSRLLKFVFDLPSWLYQRGWGWMLGSRVLAVTHKGRRSGREFQTILETMSFDKETGESIVASAYGSGADWYRNIQQEPASRISTGRLDFVPEQRFLNDSEAREAADRFCREHPFEARLVPRVLPAIGAAIPTDPDLSPAEMLATLPMVAFRPKS